MESEVRQIIKSIDYKKMTLQNICSDITSEKKEHLSTNEEIRKSLILLALAFDNKCIFTIFKLFYVEN